MATNRPGISLLSKGNPARAPYHEELLANKDIGEISIRTKAEVGGDIISYQSMARLSNTVNRFIEKISLYDSFDEIKVISIIDESTSEKLVLPANINDRLNSNLIVGDKPTIRYSQTSYDSHKVKKIMINIDADVVKVVDGEVSNEKCEDIVEVLLRLYDGTSYYDADGTLAEISTIPFEIINDVYEVTLDSIQLNEWQVDYDYRVILHSILVAVKYVDI